MSSETTTNVFTYSLIPILLSAIAVAISGITFYINHVTVRKSEQIRICRDIFNKVFRSLEDLEELTKKQNKLDEKSYNFELLGKLRQILFEFDYYALLVRDEEITNNRLLRHYNKLLVEILQGIKFIIATTGLIFPPLDKDSMERNNPNLFELLRTNKKLEEVFY